ncbi:MAG: ABC transporter permease, partial [Thermoplasmata archaeon]
PKWRPNKTFQVAALVASSALAGVLTFAYLSSVFSGDEYGLWGILILLPLVSIVASEVALMAAFKRIPEWRLNKPLQVAALIASSALTGILTFACLSLAHSGDEYCFWGALIMLPLVSTVASAVALIAAFRRTQEWRLNKSLQIAALVAPLALTGILTFAYLSLAHSGDGYGFMSLVYSGDEYGLWGSITTEWNDWLYPASIVGACLVMFSYGTRRRVGRKRSVRRWFGIVCAVAPLAILSIFLVVDFPQEHAGYAILTGYVIGGFFLLISGMSLHSAYVLPVAAVTSSEKRGVKFPTRIATLARGTSILLALVVVITGVAVYLVENWTTHWMGTDSFEADIFSKLLYGARTSMIVGVVAAAIASILGAVIGLYSGYVGGRTDEVLMRANDVVLSIPWLVLMIVIAALIGTIDLLGIILIIGLTGWSPTARMVRAQVLSIKERQYIERARAIGASDFGIIRRHVLPNSFPLVFANTILTVAGAILSEATLSFLGMRPIGVVTWGTMLSYASNAGAFTIGLHWWIIAPGLCIVFLVLGFTLLGYALDDILNPKLRKR